MGIEMLDQMVGCSCWHVSAGGSTAPSFVLVMGEKVARPSPLQNPAQPEEFRMFRGSIELLVWSSWRLQNQADVFATSDQGETGLAQLTSLVGVPVVEVVSHPPAWDLRIRFADGREIVTFSDHVEPDASVAENWEFWSSGRHLTAGPGGHLVEE